MIYMKDVSKLYPVGEKVVAALSHVSLHIAPGEYTAIVGPSGSGKSTMMHLLGCLDTPTSGQVTLHGRDVSTLRPLELSRVRGEEIGFVFQGFQLLPQLTALENVAMPLLLAGAGRRERESRAKALLERVGLGERLHHRPSQLSGGQQQRVAFARAIVIKPSCILFDEPLSALDALLREEMRHELKDLVSALGFTSVFVTHDQTEAMSMSDKIAVLHNGVVEQYATPEEIYHHPSTAFVAHFVGKSNWLDETHLFRPEAVATSQGGGGKTYSLPVEGVQYLGDTYEVRLRFKPDVTWTVHSGRKAAVGDTLSVTIQPDQIITVNKE